MATVDARWCKPWCNSVKPQTRAGRGRETRRAVALGNQGQVGKQFDGPRDISSRGSV